MEILFKSSGVAKSNPSIRASKSKSSGFAYKPKNSSFCWYYYLTNARPHSRDCSLIPNFPLLGLRKIPHLEGQGVVVGLTAENVRDELRLRLGFAVGKAPPSGMEPVSGCSSGILEVGPAPSSSIARRRGSTNCRSLSSGKELGKERNPSARKIESSVACGESRESIALCLKPEATCCSRL
ncbi:sodium/glutamate symport carrier protein [Striga asiatica]|uniref:Sodium/glutamate symport carrier protein n=1 Tax=Striga asiatica TaxID=4170 RepID=A0A5A7Q7V5_STRAF|nr:sodium/glutamate symport carrier protein [Striga asiatica]